MTKTNKASASGLAALLALLSPHTQAFDWASAVWQNDLFIGTDGGYTNGLFLSLYDLSTEGETPYKTPLLAKPLAWMLQPSANATMFSEHSLGQAMITPSDITQAVPDPADSPYAGLLLYRVSHAVVEEDFADLVRTTAGIMGPASGAERSQELVHKITGSDQPQGWDYQLGNKFLFAFERTAVWRYSLAERWDTVLLAQAGVGNLESTLGAGAIVRFGKGLRQSFATTALQYGRISVPMAVEGGWYVYAGLEAEYVINQILVNGNSYRDNAADYLEHEQLASTVGLAYSWDSFSLAVSYKSGDSLDKNKSSKDSFGAISLAWRL
ncbi:lipid A deacylase LpxR family protein [Gilvimarinus sp. DA14]|uniref:lipid A deacylase LpxR family protein n=1 Tax=Gilvimarinus sp. DA14 TaxID=2956798 RepID=UPI0020B71AEF|nr:lipid A deacylase LpxR family protein [Gilvimarinus sp. DA14]UTF58850.1 lipid A deacylase LpxR family protein [Gilvimarinus sp. DA14]